MKFQSLKTFKSHLEAAFPNNLARLYFIIIPNDYERKKVIDFVYCYLPYKNAFTCSKFSSENHSFLHVKQALDSPSLLGGDPIIVFNDIDLLKKEDVNGLCALFNKSSLGAYIILGAKNKQSLAEIISLMDKRGVVLDLSYEKPWEKQARFSEFVKQHCARSKKTIALDAMESLFEKTGFDLATLHNEIDKLIMYAQDKSVIQKEDVEAICINSTQSTIWQVAEEIVWYQRHPKNFNLSMLDASFFHGLVAAIRFQLQFGYKLSLLLESNATKEIISSYFPKIRPKVLENKISLVKMRNSSFFKKALLNLFKTDLLSKTNVNCLLTLIDIFKAKMDVT